jgi:Flp pilus assembly protein TadD
LLIVAAAAVVAVLRRDALRERWLDWQSTETLQRLGGQEDADALTHFVYAERIARRGDTAAALPAATRAADAAPRSDRDLAGRMLALAGRLAAEAGSPRQAERYLGEATALRPSDPTVVAGLGVLALRTGRLAEGIARLREAARLDPRDLDAWNRLGSAYLLAAEPEQAVAAFRHATSVAPRDPETHAELAEALGRLARYSEAGAECGRAAALAPAVAQFAILPAISRASSARTEADYDAAIRLMDGAVGGFPEETFLHALMAGLHVRFGRYEAARREIQLFLARNPKDSNGWLNLATVCERLGDRAGAATAGARFRWLVAAEDQATKLRHLSLLHPDDPSVYLGLADALERGGRLDEELAALSKASELRPGDPAIAQRLAAVQSARSQTEAIADQFRRHEVTQ